MRIKKEKTTLLVGFEPTTFGLEVQHAFLCVTGAIENKEFFVLFKFSLTVKNLKQFKNFFEFSV